MRLKTTAALPHTTDQDAPHQQTAAEDPTAATAPTTEAPAVEPVAVNVTKAEAADPAPQSWASTFPHVEIDELMTRLNEADSVTPAETTALLGAIIDEARRLRATVVRLTAEKLSAAEREAEEILASARAEAAELRRTANEAMINRLDEAESAGAAITQAATVDATRRSRQGQQLLAQTRSEVEELRNRVSAIFDSTTGILPLLGDAASELGRMEAELAGVDGSTPSSDAVAAPRGHPGLGVTSMTNPPLLPDDIANHHFALSRRGFDPDEVRAYLTSLAQTVRQQTTELVQLRDQLALGTSGARTEGQLREEIAALQAQVTDLGNRLMLANAVRQEALTRSSELEAALIGKPPVIAAEPVPGDDLDRASNELAQVLREAKIRAAHIKADAEREATLLIDQTRRENDQARVQQQLLAEQAAIRLQERLAELCREAEARVVAANTEAARVLAQADESAARALEHASFQARRLVANAGSFTAIWVAEADELRNASGTPGSGTEEHPALLGGRSVTDALNAFTESLEADEDEPELDEDDSAEPDAAEAGEAEAAESDGEGADVSTEKPNRLTAVEDPETLLRQADQLLSIAEVVRRGDGKPEGDRREKPDQAG